ncbi:fadH, partial [Symbiodinium microadriaticum]
PLDKRQRIAVVGAGPAGLACATTAAERGHKVTLFERDSKIGGQFNMAKLIPGKEEFHETLRYFTHQLQLTGVNVQLGTEAGAEDLMGYDAVVLATGVVPRDIPLPVNTAKVQVVSYADLLKGKVRAGRRVAVIGAGGIGFDVAEFLTHNPYDERAVTDIHSTPLPAKVDNVAVDRFLQEWGVDRDIAGGGLQPGDDVISENALPARKVYLLQRKGGKFGAGLGKTTGWIHRAELKKRNVKQIGKCKYLEVTDDGLVIELDGAKHTLSVDTVVVCAGQDPDRSLQKPLTLPGAASSQARPPKVFLIGGSHEAAELDAKRAIDQGTRLAATIESAKTGDVFNAPDGLMYQ